MAGPFYFCWVGGIASPAFSLQTTGDVWGGELQTYGDVWGGEFVTQGDVTQNSATIANLARVEGLISGHSYTVTGAGIPSNLDGTPVASFTYSGGNSVTMSVNAISTQTASSITIRSSAQNSTVSNVGNITQLVTGWTYGISGSGIQSGTTFTHNGTNTFTLSLPATSTNPLTSLRITNETGANIVSNLASTAGLVVGETYSVWGPGIPPNTFSTYAGGTSLTLTNSANATNHGTFIAIKKGITESDGGAFNTGTMLVENEQIFKFDIEHHEGDFPTLRIEIRNPKVGLLGPSRQQWCWLSWDSAWAPGVATNPANVVPLFHGRIVGVPQRLSDEIVQLEFVGRPVDYFVQKSALASALQVAPYWDPVWLQRHLADPDTALEAYTAHWHIDRTSLAVTTSDILNAEDGTITLHEADHFYDGLDVSYRQPPLTSVTVTGTVTWTQGGEGDVDLTDSIVAAFRAAGSPYGSPIVGSYTGDGLLSDWPKQNAGFGGGWTMSQNSSVSDASFWIAPKDYTIKYSSHGGSLATSTLPPAIVQNPLIAESGPYGTGMSTFQNPAIGASSFFSGASNWDVTFLLQPVAIDFKAHFVASRKRTEQVVFVLNADVQPLLVDPNGADTAMLDLSSNYIDQPVDPGGALPIGDIRRNSYFATDRGQQSLQYLLLLARARLVAASRAVEIKLQCPWGKVVSTTLGLSCRKSVLLYDNRLPGGQALGKIVHYRLSASGEGTVLAELTLACAIGLGNTLAPAVPGVDTYAGSYSTGSTAPQPGGQVDVIVGTLQYSSLDGTYILDDDGVDLLNMVPSTVIKSLIVFNGPDAQKAAINAGATRNKPPVNLVSSATFSFGSTAVQGIGSTTGLVAGTVYDAAGTAIPQNATLTYNGNNVGTLSAPATASGTGPLTLSKAVTNDPVAALNATPTQVDLEMVPVTGGDFYTQISVATANLTIPQMINLAA